VSASILKGHYIYNEHYWQSQQSSGVPATSPPEKRRNHKPMGKSPHPVRGVARSVAKGANLGRESESSAVIDAAICGADLNFVPFKTAP
jgi:hypothetical protein